MFMKFEPLIRKSPNTLLHPELISKSLLRQYHYRPDAAGQSHRHRGAESVCLPEAYRCHDSRGDTLHRRRFLQQRAFLRKIVFTGVCPILDSDCFTDLPEDAVICVPDDQPEVYQAALTGTGCTAVIQPSGETAVTVDNSGFDEGDFEFDAATGAITKYNAYAAYLSIPDPIGGVP